MKFTGERYLPQVEGTIYLEHYHRYYSVVEFVQNKRVLDIACGEGYGSNLLSSCASEVVGVDIAPETVQFAKEKYSNKNLSFQQGSASEIPFKDNSFDVVVSFETIEHHDKHEEMMQEVKRVLKPDGVLIISSPDKTNYNKTLSEPNKFHVKELEFSEFKELIQRHFGHSKFYFQKLVYGSLLCEESSEQFKFISDEQKPSVYEALLPVYDLAICSDTPISGSITSFFDGSRFNQKMFDRKQNEIQAMTNSMTWKVGRFILGPFSFVKGLFAK